MNIWERGTLNDDLQCGKTSIYVRLRVGFILVHNCCKDFRASQYWVCVMISISRYVYLDCRDFDIAPSLNTKTLRRDMALKLVSSFDTPEAIWDHVVKSDMPHKNLEVKQEELS